jgi:hypothetical protein
MYTDGFNAVSSTTVDAFVFVCVEKEEPYRVEVYTLDDNFMFYGAGEYHRLLRLEKECRENQVWPNFKNDGIKTLFLPKWAAIDLDAEGDANGAF